MKRVFLTVMIAVVAAGGAATQTSFAAHLGTNLFRYESAFLVTGASVVSILADQVELNIQADFGIATNSDSESGAVDPEFLIPVGAGLNFAFPGDPLTFYLGIGLVPTIQLMPGRDDTIRFYLGPYAKTGLRVRVHSVMSTFVDVEQQLLFGGPSWINTGTKIAAGIHFSLPTE